MGWDSLIGIITSLIKFELFLCTAASILLRRLLPFPNLSFRFVVESKEISQLGVSLESLETENTNNIELNMVLESLRRVAEYSGDIAEVAINMSVKL